jgi:hypothetical protein
MLQTIESTATLLFAIIRPSCCYIVNYSNCYQFIIDIGKLGFFLLKVFWGNGRRGLGMMRERVKGWWRWDDV